MKGRWLKAIMVGVGSFVMAWGALAGDGPRDRAMAKRADKAAHNFECPVPSDIRFVAHPETRYSGNDITFYISIERFFGDRALLTDHVGWKKGYGLPKTVTLRMIVFDIDYAQGEVDQIYFNDHKVEGALLTGKDQEWSSCTFQIPIEWVNLPNHPGESVSNKVFIDVDETDDGWMTNVDWASLDIPAPPPVVISHGVWDSAGGNAALNKAVAQLGLPVYLGSYTNNGWNSIQDGANQLSKWVDEACTNWGVEKVTILCHSMGGIKAREYTTEIDKLGAKVDRVIQIATPNGGACMADAGEVALVTKAFLKEAFSGKIMRFDIKSLLPTMLSALTTAISDKPAMWQLMPDMMKEYNKLHRLNSSVHYVVLAGDCGWFPAQFSEWWEKGHLSGLVKDAFEVLRALFWGNYVNHGDGIVSVDSAHTVVSKHLKSPLKDNRATHTGLVTAGVHGMVDAVIGDVLWGDLLEQRQISSTEQETKGARTFRIGRDKDVNTSSEEKWIHGVNTAETERGEEEFQFDFMVVGVSNRVVVVDIMSDEDIEISSVRSPAGVKYTDNSGIVYMCVYEGGGGVIVASPEAGQWTVNVKRKGAWTEQALQYVVVVRESDSDLEFAGGFVEDEVAVGRSLELEVVANRGEDRLEGLQGEATLVYPDGTMDTMVLGDGEGGVYRAAFVTKQAGLHLASVQLTIDGMDYARVYAATVHASRATFGELQGDGGVDDDGDGLWDRLSVSGTIDGAEEGLEYRVFALLSDGEGNEVTWASTTVTSGDTTWRLDFDGQSIFERGTVSKYVVSTLRLFELGDVYEAELDNRDGEIEFDGETWSWAYFSHELLTVPGTGSDELVEAAGANAVYDLEAGLDVMFDESVAGTYSYSAALRAEDGTLLGRAYGSVTLSSAGRITTQRLTMRFEGGEIAETGKEGPYRVGDLLLWNTRRDFSPAGSYKTRAWSPEDFTGGSAEAEIAWKFLKATGTYFARLRVAFSGGREAGIGNLRYLFADRIGADGKTAAGLWSSQNRAALAATEVYGGETYRAVTLDSTALAAGGGEAVYGVQNLGADGVPVAERGIEMYVRKRVSPDGGNESVAGVENFVGYVAWEAGGETHAVPVAAGIASEELAALRNVAVGMRGLSVPIAATALNRSLAVGVALDDGAEPYCTVASYQTEAGRMYGTVEVGATKAGKMRRGALGANATVTLLGAETAAGPYEELGAADVGQDGTFEMDVPEGAAFFRFRIDVADTVK